MFRAGLLLAVLAACGKNKDADVAPGSGSESRGSSAPVAIAPVLPTVGHGYEPSAHPARVSISPTGIIVDGKPVAGMAGVIDGLSAPSAAPRFVLALDKTIAARVLTQLVATLKTQGLTSYGVLAQKAGGETVMVPFDLLVPRAPGADLQQPLDEMKKAAAHVKVGPSAGGRAPAATDDGPPSTVVVEVRDVTLTPESSLSPDIARTKISAAYLPGLRRCVKSFAEKDTTKASSFTLTFAINESGVGVDAKATGVTNDAAACIAEQTATWRFPVPKDAERKGIKVSATAAFDITVDEETLRAMKSNATMLPGEAVTASAEVGLAITITRDEIVVAAGALKTAGIRIPLASPDAAAQLSMQLETILKTTDQKLAVTVSPDPSTTMQQLVDLIGAMRATAAGAPLFGSVLLVVE